MFVYNYYRPVLMTFHLHKNKMKDEAILNQISTMTEASTYTHSKKVELYQVFCTFCLTCTTAFQ